MSLRHTHIVWNGFNNSKDVIILKLTEIDIDPFQQSKSSFVLICFLLVCLVLCLVVCMYVFCLFACFVFCVIVWCISYSLNVKRLKCLLFNRVKSVWNTLTEWKSLSKWVKIIPKRVKITPKRVKITPIEWISLYGEAHRGTARNKRAVPLWAPPKSEIHSIGMIFTLFGVIFTHFGMIFTRFKSNFHSVRVIFTLFTLLKSNHFTLLH